MKEPTEKEWRLHFDNCSRLIRERRGCDSIKKRQELKRKLADLKLGSIIAASWHLEAMWDITRTYPKLYDYRFLVLCGNSICKKVRLSKDGSGIVIDVDDQSFYTETKCSYTPTIKIVIPFLMMENKRRYIIKRELDVRNKGIKNKDVIPDGRVGAVLTYSYNPKATIVNDTAERIKTVIFYGENGASEVRAAEFFDSIKNKLGTVTHVSITNGNDHIDTDNVTEIYS